MKSLYYPENGAVGVLHPIWDVHIRWFLLDRIHNCHFYMSDGCVMVENSGVLCLGLLVFGVFPEQS